MMATNCATAGVAVRWSAVTDHMARLQKAREGPATKGAEYYEAIEEVRFSHARQRRLLNRTTPASRCYLHAQPCLHALPFVAPCMALTLLHSPNTSNRKECRPFHCTMKANHFLALQVLLVKRGLRDRTAGAANDGQSLVSTVS